MHPVAIPTGPAMRLALLFVVLAALLPSCRAGLGLGGLAPSPAGAPAETANINVPTDLCDKEFCLAASPAACGGKCILTPLGNSTAVRHRLPLQLSQHQRRPCKFVNW